MGQLLNELQEYFDNTPQEQLDKDWDEIKHLNEIGCDVIEYHKAFIEAMKKDPNKLIEEYLTEVEANVSIQNGNPSCKLSYASPIDTPPHKTGIPMEWLNELEQYFDNTSKDRIIRKG